MPPAIIASAYIPLIMDVVLAALLIATMVVALRLNGRLAVLRRDRNRLNDLIAGLGKATAQAEEAVAGLRLSANESGHGLQERIDRAGAISADMSFLIEKAEKLADRIEAGIKHERATGQAARASLETVERVAAARPPVAGVGTAYPANRHAAPTEPGSGGSRLAHLLRQAEAQGAQAPATSSRHEPKPDRRAASAARSAADSDSGENHASDARQSRTERELMRVLEGRR